MSYTSLSERSLLRWTPVPIALMLLAVALPWAALRVDCPAPSNGSGTSAGQRAVECGLLQVSFDGAVSRIWIIVFAVAAVVALAVLAARQFPQQRPSLPVTDEVLYLICGLVGVVSTILFAVTNGTPFSIGSSDVRSGAGDVSFQGAGLWIGWWLALLAAIALIIVAVLPILMAHQGTPRTMGAGATGAPASGQWATPTGATGGGPWPPASGAAAPGQGGTTTAAAAPDQGATTTVEPAPAREASATPAPTPVQGFSMSPDGAHWFDGTAWRDATSSVPPDAQRSEDGVYWWDGNTWRLVPPSG